MPIRYITPDSHPVGLMAQSSYLNEITDDSEGAGASILITRPLVSAANRKLTVSQGSDGRKWFELSGANKLVLALIAVNGAYANPQQTTQATSTYDAFAFRLKVDDINDLTGITISVVGGFRTNNGSPVWYPFKTTQSSWLAGYIKEPGEYYVEFKQYSVTPSYTGSTQTTYVYFDTYIDGIKVSGTSGAMAASYIDTNYRYPPVITMPSTAKLKFRDVYISGQFINSTFESVKSLNIKAKAYRAKAISGYPNDLGQITSNLLNGAITGRHDQITVNSLPTQLTGLGGQVDLTLDHDASRLRGTPISIFRYGRVNGIDTAIEVKSLVDDTVLSVAATTPTPGAILGNGNAALAASTIDPNGAKLKDVRIKFTQSVGGA